MVFIHHYFGTNCTGKFWCPVVLEMHTGVSIFFVLSGFLITYKYYQSSSLNFNWLKNYYVSRFARIYPLFFLVTVLTLIFLKSPAFEWFLTLTFLKGFFDSYKFIIISQTWTLTVEVVFYFLAPYIFVLAKKRTNLALQFVLFFLVGILIAGGGQVENFRAFTSGHIFLFIYTFLGRSFEFFVGIFLALKVAKKKNPTPGVGYGVGYLPRAGYLMGKKFTLLGLSGVIFTIILISSFQSGDYRYGIFSPEGLLLHNFALPVAISIFFWGLITEKTNLSFFLSGPLMQLLGKSSYAFYLIHLGVIAQMLPSFSRFNMFAFFISLNILAIFLYYFIEKPANLWFKKNLAG